MTNDVEEFLRKNPQKAVPEREKAKIHQRNSEAVRHRRFNKGPRYSAVQLSLSAATVTKILKGKK